jgi:hypothetical protein
MGSDIALTATLEGRRLVVRVRGAAARFRIRSDRNTPITNLTDTSPYAPKRPGNAETAMAISDEQIWFPVVDLALTPTMTGWVKLDGAGRYAVNGMFHKDIRDTAPEIAIPADRLEHWENALFIDGRGCRPVDFALDLPAAEETVLDTLTDDWRGTVSLVDGDGREVATTSVRSVRPTARGIPGGALDAPRVKASLRATVDYLLRSQVPASASPVSRGLYLFYDHDARTFRTPHWNWAWGPPVKLLLEAAEAGLAAREPTVRAADEIGAASLRFLRRAPGEKADGFSVVRWSPGLANTRKAEYVSPSSVDFPVAGWSPSHAGERFEAGYEGYVSPADTLFLMGWGWVPLHETVGGTRYREASEYVADATDRLLSQYEIIPQDLPLLVDDWTDYTREEAGFGMEGLSELHRITRDPRHRAIGERYIDGILARLERPDGLWYRHWWRSRQQITECEYKSRSLGWGEMGLLAAHRMSPERGYLDRAARLAEHFVKAQTESGAWGLVIDRPIGETEESSKGTALWSMLLYRLHRETRDPRHLEAARRGLRWLLDRQYLGDDPDGHGGVISCSAFSGVDYRRWFRLSCAYTSAFFGLAALEELRLQGEA